MKRHIFYIRRKHRPMLLLLRYVGPNVNTIHFLRNIINENSLIKETKFRN